MNYKFDISNVEVKFIVDENIVYVIGTSNRKTYLGVIG